MKKGLGQHFLKSDRVLERIVQAADIQPGDVVLEIGPGKGALTHKLLSRNARVIAVEKDEELPQIEHPSLEWIEGDILEFDLSSLPPCKVVANIPYYLSSSILQLLLSFKFTSMTLLVQKEFAEKIISLQTSLSLQAHLNFQPQIIQEVSRHHFVPPPQVTSAILHFAARPETGIDQEDFLRFAQIITRAKRKTLKSLCPTLDVPHTLRLGELSFEALLEIYQRSGKQRGMAHSR